MNSRFIIRTSLWAVVFGGIAVLVTMTGSWSFPQSNDDLPTSHFCQKKNNSDFRCGDYWVLITSKDGKPNITSSAGNCNYLDDRTDGLGNSIDDIFVCKNQNSSPVAVIVNSSLQHFRRVSFPVWSADFCLHSCRSEVASTNKIEILQYKLEYHSQSIQLN